MIRFVLFLAAAVASAAGPFLVDPYLQLGADPVKGWAVLWHTADEAAKYEVRWRVSGTSKWSKPAPAESRRVAVAGIPPHRVWSAPLAAPSSGKAIDYSVTRDGAEVFQASSKARKGAGQPYRFAVFGDCGQNTPEQRKVAYQTFQAKPDFLFITGDIVYGRGRVSEYREKYYPIYGSREAAPDKGAPLLASIPFIASPGNHDIAESDFDKYPDTAAYYYYWKQPLNGPFGEPGPFTSQVKGSAANTQAFRDAAGSHYPRMANFSFDYGNSHWTVLDANKYANWTDPAMLEWLVRDLRAAAKKKWRFVGFHQPGFNSSKAHFAEQYMRDLAPVFEREGVDVVFTGHVHNYQRSFPLTYEPASKKWTLDRQFKAGPGRPRGVIYLVTGAGGAKLYNPEQQDDKKTWQEFTDVFVSKINSVTVADVEGGKLTIRQIAADGSEVDRFVVVK